MKKYPGVVVGIVESVDDPRGEGRVQVSFPWLPGLREYPWAPVAVAMAGKDRGMYFLPEIKDEALVAFEQGDFDHPYIIGFLWNGVDRPPEDDHKSRLFRSANGHEIAINDSPVTEGDSGGIRIEDAQGNIIKLSNGRIEIESTGTFTVTAPNIILTGFTTINGTPQ